MDHFLYRDGVLHAEDVPVSRDRGRSGHAVLSLFHGHAARHFRCLTRRFGGCGSPVCYAMKAASQSGHPEPAGAAGAGMDVVSGGEYARARAAGVPGERIVFSGVGKTRAEMRQALDGGIRQFNVESEPEMVALIEVAISLGCRADHASGSIPMWMPRPMPRSRRAKARTSLAFQSRAREVYADGGRVCRVWRLWASMCISASQLTDLAPLGQAYEKVAELTETAARRWA